MAAPKRVGLPGEGRSESEIVSEYYAMGRADYAAGVDNHALMHAKLPRNLAAAYDLGWTSGASPDPA